MLNLIKLVGLGLADSDLDSLDFVEELLLSTLVVFEPIGELVGLLGEFADMLTETLDDEFFDREFVLEIFDRWPRSASPK